MNLTLYLKNREGGLWRVWVLLINTWPPKKNTENEVAVIAVLWEAERKCARSHPPGAQGQAAPGKTAGRGRPEEGGVLLWGQGSQLRAGAFVLSLEQEVLDKKWKKKGIQAVITVCVQRWAWGWAWRQDGRAAPSAAPRERSAWRESVVRGSERLTADPRVADEGVWTLGAVEVSELGDGRQSRGWACCWVWREGGPEREVMPPTPLAHSNAEAWRTPGLLGAGWEVCRPLLPHLLCPGSHLSLLLPSPSSCLLMQSRQLLLSWE